MQAVDLGDLMMKCEDKGSFECWKDVRVVEIVRCGTFMIFRRGDKAVVDAICHEDMDGDDTPRFQKMMTAKPPLEDEGWSTTLVWKCMAGNYTADELKDKLDRQDELKGWRVKAMEPQPMKFLFSDSQIARLVRQCDIEEVDRPTAAEAFGENSGREIDKLVDWHGNVIRGKKRKQTAARNF